MKMKRLRFTAILAVVLLVALVGGCGLSGSKEKENLEGDAGKPETEAQNGENNTPPVSPQPTKEEIELTLYFGDDQAMYLEPEKRTVPKEGKPLAELLIEGLINGPKDERLSRTIPDGTKLLSLEVVDGVAFVNFSKEMMTNHWGGTAGETMTSQSVALTLTQLPEIEKVQFLIAGKKEESIWGHGDTTEPISPQKDLISPKRTEAQ